MSKVKILVVEDELLVAEDIRLNLINFGYEVTGLARSYNEAINLIMADLPDLVMLDIYIAGDKNGIELGHFLRTEVDIPFIYLTANSDKITISNAKKTNPNGYLVKPFQPESLYASIEMALTNAGVKSSYEVEQEPSEELRIKDSLFIKKDHSFIKVKITEIKYISADGNYLDIYKSKDEKFTIRSTIKKIGLNLPNDLFFIPHKSYIVNLSMLDEVAPTSLLIDGNEIPLSKNKKEELFARMNTFS